MKKPHETTLSVETFDGEGRRALVDGDDRMVAVFRAQETEEWERFLPAAPDMARALMAIRARVAEAGRALPRERDADQMAAMEDSMVTIPTALLRDAFAALRKAGVLP